jgi:hypothetical protein
MTRTFHCRHRRPDFLLRVRGVFSAAVHICREPFDLGRQFIGRGGLENRQALPECSGNAGAITDHRMRELRGRKRCKQAAGDRLACRGVSIAPKATAMILRASG